MKYRLMDIIACPYDKTFPLKLYVFEEKTYERSLDYPEPYCEEYCEYLKSWIKDLKEKPPCKECIKKEIVSGILYCPTCKRWYPIMEEIPVLLPDEYRKKKEELKFLREHKDKVPKEILEEGLPFNLKEED